MRYLILFLKGIAMGASDLIPGISGGTIALITGIYKELLESINALSWRNLKKIMINIKTFWKDINGAFLLPLFCGITISILFFSRYIEYLIKEQTIALWSFFFGLLFASIIFLIRKKLSLKFNSLIYISIGIISLINGLINLNDLICSLLNNSKLIPLSK